MASVLYTNLKQFLKIFIQLDLTLKRKNLKVLTDKHA
jgi:hypothetical protein